VRRIPRKHPADDNADQKRDQRVNQAEVLVLARLTDAAIDQQQDILQVIDTREHMLRLGHAEQFWRVGRREPDLRIERLDAASGRALQKSPARATRLRLA